MNYFILRFVVKTLSMERLKQIFFLLLLIAIPVIVQTIFASAALQAIDELVIQDKASALEAGQASLNSQPIGQIQLGRAQTDIEQEQDVSPTPQGIPEGVSQLPPTGETPWWRNVLVAWLTLAGFFGIIGGLSALQRTAQKSKR